VIKLFFLVTRNILLAVKTKSFCKETEILRREKHCFVSHYIKEKNLGVRNRFWREVPPYMRLCDGRRSKVVKKTNITFLLHQILPHAFYGKTL